MASLWKNLVNKKISLETDAKENTHLLRLKNQLIDGRLHKLYYLKIKKRHTRKK